jgi:hypothetical protein
MILKMGIIPIIPWTDLLLFEFLDSLEPSKARDVGISALSNKRFPHSSWMGFTLLGRDVVSGITSLFKRDSLSRPDTTLHSSEGDSLGLLPFQLYVGDKPDVNVFLVSLSERRVFYSRKNSTSILTQLKEVGPRKAFLLLCIYEYRPGNAGRHRSQFLSQFCVDEGRR